MPTYRLLHLPRPKNYPRHSWDSPCGASPHATSRWRHRGPIWVCQRPEIVVRFAIGSVPPLSLGASLDRALLDRYECSDSPCIGPGFGLLHRSTSNRGAKLPRVQAGSTVRSVEINGQLSSQSPTRSGVSASGHDTSAGLPLIAVRSLAKHPVSGTCFLAKAKLSSPAATTAPIYNGCFLQQDQSHLTTFHCAARELLTTKSLDFRFGRIT